MKITGIETLLNNHSFLPHTGRNRWLWVRLYTDEGLVGLGETFPDGYPEAAIIHETLGRVLMGRNPLDIEALWWDMFTTFDYYGWAGAEMRALSAIDIALWDLAGRYAGLPTYQILGGKVREIPVYNTCYEREFDTLKQPGALAEFLLDQNINMMKIWPFDQFAVPFRGQWISDEDLEKGARPIKEIRNRVGKRMSIALDGHGYWSLNAALRIARALDPYEIFWLEDMLPSHNLEGYRELARGSSIPLCLSERFMTAWQYLPVLRMGLAKMIMIDIAWTGGISEARKICALAGAHDLPITFHNAGGPVLCSATAHLAATTRNLLNVETVRPYFEDYAHYAEGFPQVQEGRLLISDLPGHGVKLRVGIEKTDGLLVRRTGPVAQEQTQS